MTPTIKDVAARAGVSPKTVSRVMNNEAHVRPEVRDEVMRVVAELRYQPNAFARSLSSARSNLLALFIDDAASGYASTVQRGALDRCRTRGYHLIIEALDLSAPGWEERLAGSVRQLRLEGAILAPPLSQNEALLDRLDALDLPVVRISPDPRAHHASAEVSFDEEGAAFDMTMHLLALGHRDIGFVEGNRAHAAASLRRAGFERAMAAGDCPIAPNRIRPGDFSFRAGLEAGEALLSGDPRPTAIFASNDDMALGVSVAALKHHVVVPDDLAIAGFDDAPTARLAWPQISTVRQPTEQMGATAVEMLIDASYRHAKASDRYQRRMDYELILRASTEAPGRTSTG